MRSSIFMGSMAFLALNTACTCTDPCCDEGFEVVKQSYVHKYGVEVDPVSWNERGGHGQVVTTQKNGVTINQNYVDGVLQGDTTYSFPHSTAVEKVATYDKGTLVSETVYFRSAGQKMMTEYTPSRPDYLIITQWYENGAQRSRETFINDRIDEGYYYDMKGQVESSVTAGSGDRYERNDSGELLSSDKYVNGEVVETTYYYPHKSLKEVIPYANGTIHGMRKFYFVGGDPDRFEEWTNGRQTGTTIMFQHGEKIAEVPYVNGMKSGLEKRYRDGEFVVEEVTWVDGKQHGPHTTYIGSESTVDWFYNDKRMTKTQFDRMAIPQIRT